MFSSALGLKEKMNKPLTEIHEPVPHYAEVLGKPVERFNSMKIGPISMRMNWSQANDALYAPVRLYQPDWIPGVNHDQIYVRVERQTFRKLARSGHILFTIRTYLTPVSTWRDNDEAIEDLLSALGDMSPEMRHYKGPLFTKTPCGKCWLNPKHLFFSGREKVMSIDTFNIKIIPDGQIDRLTNAGEPIVLSYPLSRLLPV